MPTPREVHNEPWRLMATLPSTNVKTVVGVAMAVATMVQLFALQRSGHDTRIVVALWDSWLIFLGSLIGIAAAQYAWKRKTYDPHGPEAQRAAASEPGPAAEAVRERGTAVELTKVTAEHGVPTPVPVPMPVPVAVPVHHPAAYMPPAAPPPPAGDDVPGRGD